MKDFSLYFLIMVLGLGSAYWASLPSKNNDEDKVAIATIIPSSLKDFSYVTPETTVTVTAQDNGNQFWIDFTKLKSDKKQDNVKKDTHEDEANDSHDGHDHNNMDHTEDGNDLGESAESAEPVAETSEKGTSTVVEKHEKFKASEKIKDIVDGFNPFQALRVIGSDQTPEQLKEFGILDSKEKIEITNKDNQKFEYILGSKSYGSRNRFLQDVQSGKVLLVDGRPFESLERANFRLYERRIYNFELEDVTSVDIKADEKVSSLVHTTRNAKGELQWTHKEATATSKSSYESWMNKIHRLRLMNFQAEDVQAQLKESKPFLEISFNGKSGSLDHLSFYKTLYKVAKGANGAVVGTDAKNSGTHYWVYSKFLGAFAELSANRMDPIEKDLESILEKP